MPESDIATKSIGEWVRHLEQVVFQVLVKARCEAVAEVGLAYVRASWSREDRPSGIQGTPDLRWRPNTSDWREETDRRHRELEEDAKKHPLAALFYGLDRETQAFENLIKSSAAVDNDEGGVHRLATGVQASGYNFVALVEFDASEISMLPTLRPRTPERAGRPISLLDACIRASLSWFAGQLAKGLYSSRLSISARDVEGILRHAGSIVMGAMRSHVSDELLVGGDLFVYLDRISMQRHERAEGRGRILFVPINDLADAPSLVLEESVPFDRTQWVRKLLETCHGDMCLASAGTSIDAVLSRIDREQVPTVEFVAQQRWMLSAGAPVMRVEGGLPAFPQYGLPRSKFAAAFGRVFPRAAESMDVVWKAVSSILAGDHGALVVVSADAESEAKRLATQGTLVVSQVLDDALSQAVARVDGAILIDPSGTCHGFGFVLDGEVCESGTPARGARFNSALRYVANSSERLAVVRSEDGHVDLLPRLRPQVRRSQLEAALNDLRRNDDAAPTRALRNQAQLVWMYRFELDLEQADLVRVDKLRQVISHSIFGDRGDSDEMLDCHPTTDVLPE